MDVLDVYIHELKRCAAIPPCDHTLKQFVLQDVITECGKLKVICVCTWDFQKLLAQQLCVCVSMFKVGICAVVFMWPTKSTNSWCTTHNQLRMFYDIWAQTTTLCTHCGCKASLERNRWHQWHYSSTGIFRYFPAYPVTINGLFSLNLDHNYASMDIEGGWEVG